MIETWEPTSASELYDFNKDVTLIFHTLITMDPELYYKDKHYFMSLVFQKVIIIYGKLLTHNAMQMITDIFIDAAETFERKMQ